MHMKEICTNFHEKNFIHIFAISIFLNDSNPDAYGVDETLQFSSLFDWVSTNGILDYLETRYQEAVADTLG